MTGGKQPAGTKYGPQTDKRQVGDRKQFLKMLRLFADLCFVLINRGQESPPSDNGAQKSALQHVQSQSDKERTLPGMVIRGRLISQ